MSTDPQHVAPTLAEELARAREEGRREGLRSALRIVDEVTKDLDRYTQCPKYASVPMYIVKTSIQAAMGGTITMMTVPPPAQTPPPKE